MLSILFVSPPVMVILLIIICNLIIKKQSQPFHFNEVVQLPINRVGIVLGTSKYTRGNRPNLYFKYRISAAEALYKSGKIKKILLSGAKKHTNYDEPTDMKMELLKVGIPETDIYLDAAGFRTLDSVVRAKKIFSLHAFTIISQEFHNQRALYIANHYGIDAIAFNAQEVEGPAGIRMQLREKLAKVKTIIDLHVTNRQPRVLGEPIDIF